MFNFRARRIRAGPDQSHEATFDDSETIIANTPDNFHKDSNDTKNNIRARKVGAVGSERFGIPLKEI